MGFHLKEKTSLFEIKVDDGVEVEVEVEAGVEAEVLRCNLDLTLVVVSTFTGGWLGGRKIGE